MNQLISISKADQIPPEYQNTPIELLLEYHNLDRSLDNYSQAQLLIGMCMDNRKRLRLPDNFAFVIRSGGANLRHSEFKVSFAIAVGGVNFIALIGHNHCGMVGLGANKEQFIQGLVERAGWERDLAEQHFQVYAPKFEIGNEIDFILSEAERLRLRYPKIPVAPMLYQMEDNLLYLIRESQSRENIPTRPAPSDLNRCNLKGYKNRVSNPGHPSAVCGRIIQSNSVLSSAQDGP